MASQKPSFKELLDRGEIVAVTSVGTICGLDKYEYCIRDGCEYWDKEKHQCLMLFGLV